MLRVDAGPCNALNPASEPCTVVALCLAVLRKAHAYPDYLNRAVSECNAALAALVTKDKYCWELSLVELEEEVLAPLGWRASADGNYKCVDGTRVFSDPTDSTRATIVYMNGTYYRGPVNKAGEPEGVGDLFGFCEALAYQGGWKGGRFDGEGVEYHAYHDDYAEYHQYHMGTVCCGRDSYKEYYMNSWTTNSPWYTGSFKNGKYNGQGRMCGSYQYASDDRHNVQVGQFKDGLLDGVGEYSDGWFRNRYKGEFKAGKLDGQGSIEYSTGLRYEGGFRAGKRHGVNASYDSDGFCHYRGEFVDGVQQGPGTCYYKDGSWFEGIWSQNNPLRSSPGFFFPDGTAHEGSWVNYVATSGIHRYLNGDVYNGELSCASRSGTGTCEYANGDVYDGEWKYDKPHGKGLWCFYPDDYYQGDWYNGRYDGRGVYGWSDGCRFEASWRNGLPTAAGVFSPKRLCTAHAKTCKSKTFLQPPTDGD